MMIQEQLAWQAWILTGVVILATAAILVAIVWDRHDRKRGSR